MKNLLNESKHELASLNNEELKKFYQEVNARLARSLLSGARLEGQQENINMLNRISEELNRRKTFPGKVHDTGNFFPS